MAGLPKRGSLQAELKLTIFSSLKLVRSSSSTHSVKQFHMFHLENNQHCTDTVPVGNGDMTNNVQTL